MNGAKIINGALELNGQSGYVATAPLGRDIKEKTLESWVKLNSLDQRGGAPMSLQTLDGKNLMLLYLESVSPSDGWLEAMAIRGQKLLMVRKKKMLKINLFI